MMTELGQTDAAPYLAGLAPYWDGRFDREGLIWGQEPSSSAELAWGYWREAGVGTILVPGCGYGRHTRFFSQQGADVEGIEISPVAVDLARAFDPSSRLYRGSALDPSLCPGPYDAIYGFNLLHLFRAPERAALIALSRQRLRHGGLAFFTAFAETDAGYGAGAEVEPNTFESRPGRPAHYFTAEDLRQHFAAWEMLAEGQIDEPEDHGQGPHTHALRWILARTGHGSTTV
jgi:SAM-dependent methyltransferase